MWRKAMLRLKSKLHTPLPVRGAFTALGATTAAVGLLLMSLPPQAQSRASFALPSASPHPGYHRGVASWYYDKGLPTACGFHAKYGVANKTLACGTHVHFIYHGHRVTATVDDRGPYIAGRTWDFGQRTRRVLHFGGVHMVWAKW